MRVGEGIAGQVVISGETINIDDVNTDPRFLRLDKEPTYRSLMVAAVHSGERKLGTISVSSNLPFAFGAGEINLLSQLGTQAAIAIENAHLLESTQQALKESNALYRINRIKPFVVTAQDSPRSKTLREQYARIMADEDFSAWLATVRSAYPVDINKAALESKERQ